MWNSELQPGKRIEFNWGYYELLPVKGDVLGGYPVVVGLNSNLPLDKRIQAYNFLYFHGFVVNNIIGTATDILGVLFKARDPYCRQSFRIDKWDSVCNFDWIDCRCCFNDNSIRIHIHPDMFSEDMEAILQQKGFACETEDNLIWWVFRQGFLELEFCFCYFANSVVSELSRFAGNLPVDRLSPSQWRSIQLCRNCGRYRCTMNEKLLSVIVEFDAEDALADDFTTHLRMLGFEYSEELKAWYCSAFSILFKLDSLINEGGVLALESPVLHRNRQFIPNIEVPFEWGVCKVRNEELKFRFDAFIPNNYNPIDKKYAQNMERLRQNGCYFLKNMGFQERRSDCTYLYRKSSEDDFNIVSDLDAIMHDAKYSIMRSVYDFRKQCGTNDFKLTLQNIFPDFNQEVLSDRMSFLGALLASDYMDKLEQQCDMYIVISECMDSSMMIYSLFSERHNVSIMDVNYALLQGEGKTLDFYRNRMSHIVDGICNDVARRLDIPRNRNMVILADQEKPAYWFSNIAIMKDCELLDNIAGLMEGDCRDKDEDSRFNYLKFKSVDMSRQDFFKVTSPREYSYAELEEKNSAIGFRDDGERTTCGWQGTLKQFVEALEKQGLDEFINSVQSNVIKTFLGRRNGNISIVVEKLRRFILAVYIKLVDLAETYPDMALMIGYPLLSSVAPAILFAGNRLIVLKYAEGAPKTLFDNERYEYDRLMIELETHPLFNGETEDKSGYYCILLWNCHIDDSLVEQGDIKNVDVDFLESEINDIAGSIDNMYDSHDFLLDFISKKPEPDIGNREIVDMLWNSNPYVSENKAIRSTDVPVTLDFISSQIEDAKANGKKKILMLTGIAGSGKTYVGLKTVKDMLDRSDSQSLDFKGEDDVSDAFYMTGNFGLYAVLKSEFLCVNCQDDYKPIRYLKEFLENPRDKGAHVVVFDESQRIKSAEYVRNNYRCDCQSQAQILLGRLARLDWCVLLLLIGPNQELQKTEGNYLDDWVDAFNANPSWEVYASEKLHLEGIMKSPVFKADSLHLNQQLRNVAKKNSGHSLFSFRKSHKAQKRLTEIEQNIYKYSKIDRFIEALLKDGEEGVEEAAESYRELGDCKFHISLYDDKNKACENIKSVGDGNNSISYGFIRSDNCKEYDFAREFKLDTRFSKFEQSRNFRDIALWFDPTSNQSCRQLNSAADAFFIQGLELDYPIVIWQPDFRRENGIWVSTAGSSADENMRYKKNLYRVLLSRARYGMYIVVPKGKWYELNETYEYLDRILR